MARQKYNTEVQPRRAELSEREKREFDLKLADKMSLQNRTRFLDEVGIEIDTDWSIPKTNIIPRMFIITQDKDGHDKTMTFSAAGIKPGSREFWEEAFKGNVFVYPAGQKEPSQLQIKFEGGTTEFSYSKPVNKNNYPDPPVKPLSFWQKVQNFFTGKYKKESTAWNSRVQDREDNIQRLKDHGEMREDFLKDEKKHAEARQAELKEQIRQKALDSDFDSAKKDADAFEKCPKRMANLFRPDPIPDPELLPPEDKSQNQDSFYTMDQFNTLTRYSKDELDLDKIKIGENGPKATVEDFAAVAMFAIWDEKIALKAKDISLRDPYAYESLKANGFTEEEINKSFAAHSRNFLSGDLFMTKPRAKEGLWLKPFVDPGRQAAADAFKDYQKGDKDKLAAIIADGISKSAKATAGLEGKFSAQDKAWLHNSEKLIQLMEKDPALKTLALQKGMTEENIKTVAGANKIYKMMGEAAKANKEIAEARAKGNDLTSEEKMKYAKAVIKAKLAQAQVDAENSASNPELDMKKMQMLMKGKKLPEEMESGQVDRINRPAPGLAKADNKMDIYVDTKTFMLGGMSAVMGKIPEYPAKLMGAEEANLDKQAEYICNKHDLGNKSVDELFDSLYNNKLNVSREAMEAKNAIDAANAQKQAVSQVKQPEKDQVLHTEHNQPQIGGPAV